MPPKHAPRIVVLAIAIVLVVTACGQTKGGSAATATTAGSTGGAGSSTSVAASPGTIAQSAGALAGVLAANGIATVADESAKAPLVGVTGAVKMRFTAAQVDALVPPTAGQPPLSYLLAAWVSTGTSSGAVSVRTSMGPQDWSDAPAVVFPTVALPLFTADVITAVTPAGGTNGATPTSQGAVGSIAGAPIPAVLAGVVDAPCTLVANFMQGVLDTVFHALMLKGPGGSGIVADIGGFLVNLWNVAVSLAQKVVNGLVKAVGDLVVGKLASIAASAATIAEIASNITPWTVKVTADPASVELGGKPGAFKAVVSAGGGIDYPSAVKDCASALKISLPTLNPKGASATWAVDGPITTTSPTTVTLDASGANTLSFTTGPDECPNPSVPAANQVAHAKITVTRPAIDKLKTLVSTLISSLPTGVSTVAGPILQPLVTQVLNKLDTITQLSGSGSVSLTPSTSGAGETSCVCPVGHWKVVEETVALLHATGGAGATVDIAPDGTVHLDHAGSAPLVGPDGLSIQYFGSEVEMLTLPTDVNQTSGTWEEKVVSGNVSVTTTVFGVKTTKPVGFDPTASATGSWTCSGNTMTTTYAGVGETETLSRQG